MRTGRRTTCLISTVALLTPVIGRAQADTARRASAPSRVLRGVVTGRGVPVSGANVFDLETLEGAITVADGRFIISITDSARAWSSACRSAD